MRVGQLVYFLAGLRKYGSANFHKIRRRGDTGTRKNPLDFGGNPDHVTLRLE